jgi:hypothetical protein
VEIALHWIAEQPDIKAPATMGESFESMAEAGAISTELAERLRKAVGFRNLAGDQPTSNVAGAPHCQSNGAVRVAHRPLRVTSNALREIESFCRGMPQSAATTMKDGRPPRGKSGIAGANASEAHCIARHSYAKELAEMPYMGHIWTYAAGCITLALEHKSLFWRALCVHLQACG